MLEVHELLDRFELLYGDKNPILSDLRRAILDDDLSSIFRVANHVAGERSLIDNLRQAVMEKNIHAMFRVLNSFEPQLETASIGKVINDDSIIENFRRA